MFGSQAYANTRAQRQRNRFSLLSLVIASTVVTFVTGVATVGINAAVLAVVLEVVAILVCVELLIRNFPRAIKKAISDNAYRIDGSLSKRRRDIEKRSLKNFRWNLVTATALIATPATLMVFGIHTYVMPLPLGFDAASKFRLSSEEWKQGIREAGIEGRYDTWQGNGEARSAVDRRAIKHATWRGAPLVIVIFVAVVVMSFSALRSVYLAALKSLATEVGRRSLHYDECDLQRVRQAG